MAIHDLISWPYMTIKSFFLILFLVLVSEFSYSQSLESSGTSEAPTLGSAKSEEEISKVVAIVNSVEENNNFIHSLNPDSIAHLPFGLIKQIGNTRYTIAIDSMKFKPNGAYFSAYAAIDFPGTLKKLAFKASNVKFNPSGVIGGEQARLYLVSNHLIRINSTVSLFLKGNNESWLEWDCNGFKKIRLKGNFIFNRGKLIPDPTQTNDTAVTANFEVDITDIENVIAAINITPFEIAGLKNWSFKVTNAIVDMSTLNNSTTMMFPQGYDNPNLINPAMWTGFELQALKIKLPREISKAGQRTEINVNNLLIDNMGVSGLFNVKNIFSINEGSMSGWRFSVEELSLGFVTNQLSSGQIKGRIHLPVMDSLQSLAYNASMNYNITTNDLDYNFMVNPVSNIEFKAFSANVSLNNNSSICFKKIGNTFRPTAVLNGLMAFNHNKINSNGGKLAFQDLTIITQAPYITNGIFTLHNINGSQTRSVNYPISINDITFGINQGAPVLGFSITLNLSDQTNNSLSIGTSILLKGKIETGEKTYSGPEPVTYNVSKWKFDKAILNGFSIDLQTSPFTLAGTVIFKDNDPVYGDAFFGTLNMSIKKVIPNPVEVSVCFGSKEDYRFFYVDAKVPTAFDLGSLPVKITRLIGGLYYHMSPNKSTEAEYIALRQNFSGVAGNALNYLPDNSVSLGLKTGVSYEFSANEVPYNGDLMFGITFTSAGGLGTVSLSGDVYSLASLAHRDKAPVKGKMTMIYDAENRIFDALALVNINSYQVISGVGYFKIHFDPQVWYLAIGTPSVPNNINILNLVNVPSYFMVGNSLPPPMAPPQAVMNISSVAAVLGNRNQTQLQNGGGFCAGVRISSSFDKTLGFNIFNARAAYSFDLGFDMMMTNYGPNSNCGDKKIGMNGWLANGSMYLHMNGAVTINGHLKLTGDCPREYSVNVPFHGEVTIKVPCLIDESFSYTVLSGDATSVVSGRGPSPVYFEGTVNCSYNLLGQITGGFQFGLDYGNNCTPVSN